MIRLIRDGDLFESSCQTLVNTVNCVGVMGKGIAKEFKKRYPLMFARYHNICSRGLLKIGTLYLWKGNDKWVLNFPTKKHWKNSSQIEWIELGLKKFLLSYKEKGIKSIAFPMLGCNNGGLDKNDVLPLMREYLDKCDDLDIEIYI